MSLVDRNVSTLHPYPTAHCTVSKPYLNGHAEVSPAVHAIVHAALLVLALHLVVIGILLVMSLYAGFTDSVTLYSTLAPLLLAAGLLALLTVLRVRTAGLNMRSMVEGLSPEQKDHHHACMNDVIRAIDVEAKALVMAAESTHHYEFIDIWKEHLKPSAHALLGVFDKLSLETLSSFHSLFLVLSIRSHFSMLLEAGNRYAKASASIAAIRNEENGSDDATLALITLRESLCDKWLERLHARHTLLSTQLNRFTACASVQHGYD